MDSIYRNRLLLGIAAMVILITPVAVYAATFLDIRLAVVKTTSNKVDKASFTTKASIPRDGSGGAFGYGILTGESVIVSTTHKGVLDSEAQNKDKNNPVFHNHYVHLGIDAVCGPSPPNTPNVVTAITFDSPGRVAVGGSSVFLKDLPKTSEELSQNNNLVGPKVVSFKLEPRGGAVCVTDIKPADKVVVN